MSGFESPNYTMVPNDYFELIVEMTTAEIRVLSTLLRSTFGYHRDEVKLSIRELARQTKMSPQSVVSGAEKLEERGLIERSTVLETSTTVWRVLVNSDTGLYQKIMKTVSTSTAKSRVKESKEKEIKEITRAANKTVDYILENERRKSYENRDKIPEPYLEYCDAYVELTGQEPRKSVVQDWLLTFAEWKAAVVQVKHIRGAYEDASRPGGFLPTRPGSLTNKAIALKGRDKVRVEARPEVFRAGDHPDPVYVPAPPDIADKLRGFVKSKEVKS